MSVVLLCFASVLLFSDVQSISSLFEHIGLHDAPSKQKHLKTSLDMPTNDPKSLQNPESCVPAPSKSRRQGHRRKNRIVPANDSAVVPSVQMKPTDTIDRGPVGSQHPVVAEGIGYASSFPGCSSLSGGSSMMARSSTIGGSSSITGGSSVGCGTSNSFQGSDVRAESAVSESRGTESVDEEDTAEVSAHCKDVAYKTAFSRIAKHNELNPNMAESANSEPEKGSGHEEYSEDGESEEGEDALLNRSPSNFTVASSDTEALSIKLDVDYQPVESATDDPPQLKAVPPSSNVIKVSPIKPLTGFPRKSLYDLPTSEVTGIIPSDKPTYPSQTTHNSTQTSSFLPAFVNPHSPYSMYGYGPYMPPPPMYCMPNAETPIWPPPIGYPAYFYPPYFEPRPYFPFPPSYYSQFTPPPAPYELINPLPRNQGSRADVTPKAQSSAQSESQSRNTSQQTESSSGSQANFRWNEGRRPTTFRPTAGNKSRDYGCQSLLEMVELMTPQLDSGTESQDSASTPRRYEIDEKKEESRKSKRRQRRQWLKTLTADGGNDHSDTSV